MSTAPLFHGRISTDGRFELADSERELRREYFRTLAGKNVEIVVRKERTKRTIDQNAYLHAVPFPILAEYFGYTIPEVKIVLMGECWGWKQLGEHEVPIKPSTSEMTVEEGTYFIDWLIPWALTNHDVVIPLPNEVAA